MFSSWHPDLSAEASWAGEGRSSVRVSVRTNRRPHLIAPLRRTLQPHTYSDTLNRPAYSILSSRANSRHLEAVECEESPSSQLAHIGLKGFILSPSFPGALPLALESAPFRVVPFIRSSCSANSPLKVRPECSGGRYLPTLVRTPSSCCQLPSHPLR